MTAETKTYFRPTNAETGEPLLTTYFTAALFKIGEAHDHDLDTAKADMVADVRDHLHRLGIPIRPVIRDSRLRILQDIEPDENGRYQPAWVHSTVMVFLTDAEPDDPRLDELSGGFIGERTKVRIEFSIPTEESEAELIAEIEAVNERGRRYLAKASAERARHAEEDRKSSGSKDDPFSADMSGLFD